jgi:hypothetical protein
MRVLQTLALPLGHVAKRNRQVVYRPAGQLMERAKRFELSTFSLARRRSTTELHPPVGKSARTQARTGDTCIFSAVLYRLSYPGNYSSDSCRASVILSNASRDVKCKKRPGGFVSRINNVPEVTSGRLSSLDFCIVFCSHYTSPGSGCVPVDAPVFKIGGRSRRASGSGFDSHPLPPLRKP